MVSFSLFIVDFFFFFVFHIFELFSTSVTCFYVNLTIITFNTQYMYIIIIIVFLENNYIPLMMHAAHVQAKYYKSWKLNARLTMISLKTYLHRNWLLLSTTIIIYNCIVNVEYIITHYKYRETHCKLSLFD
jgi:hypothetical protein